MKNEPNIIDLMEISYLMKKEGIDHTFIRKCRHLALENKYVYLIMKEWVENPELRNKALFCLFKQVTGVESNSATKT